MVRRKKLVIAIGLLALCSALAWLFLSGGFDDRVDAAFTNERCPEASPRTYPDGSYTGPLYDTHIHIPAISELPIALALARERVNGSPVLGVNATMTDIACTFATEGTEKVFAFFSVYKETPKPMVDVVKRTSEAYPGMFIPFIMPPDHDDSPDGSPTVDAETLDTMLAIAPGLFEGYGEIGLYARDGGSAELPPDDPRLLDIYPIVRDQQLLVYVHLGEGHQDNFERALDLYPEVNFIFHGDQLVVYEADGHQNLNAIDEILTNHPNAHYGVDELYGDTWMLRPEVSKDEFLAYFANYEPLLAEDVTTWKAFIERHPNQVLWGTDRGWSAAWSLDTDVGLLLTDYARAFIGRLDADVQEQFAYRNAERLLEVR